MLQSRGGQSVAVVLATALVVMAGCSGLDDGEQTVDTTPASTSTPIDVSGEVHSRVDGLTVVSHESRIVADSPIAKDEWAVVVEFRNTGNKSTDPIHGYSYNLTVYDDSDEEMAVGGPGASSKGPIQPGETGTVIFVPEKSVNLQRLGGYEVWLTCDYLDDGEYCE